MAVYVQLERAPDEAGVLVVVYTYRPDGVGDGGIVAVSTVTNQAELRVKAPNDPSGKYAQYALARLRQYAQRGDFPARGSWSS